MYSRAKIKDHPIHPMLVAFPITFYTLAFVAFAVYQWGDVGTFWYQLAYFSTFAGVITAIAAAIPGVIDWSGIPRDSAAKQRGRTHALLNVSTLILFIIIALSIWGEWTTPPESVGLPLALSFIGTLLTVAAGYHGWELIATHKVGVLMTPEQERLEPVHEISREAHKGQRRSRRLEPSEIRP